MSIRRRPQFHLLAILGLLLAGVAHGCGEECNQPCVDEADCQDFCVSLCGTSEVFPSCLAGGSDASNTDCACGCAAQYQCLDND